METILPGDVDFEIVVEAKAGSAVINSGSKYFLRIVVRDLTDFSVVHTDGLRGNLAFEPWDKPAFSYAFRIPAQGATRMYRIFEALAILSIGISNPNVSFAKSPMFVIYKV